MCKLKKTETTYNLYEGDRLINNFKTLKFLNAFIEEYDINNYKIEEAGRNGEPIKRVC